MVGHSIHPQEPLMTAGLDSLGGMELRRALAETLSLDLPQTLLYDFQSIAAITGHLNSLIEGSRPNAPVQNEGSLAAAPVSTVAAPVQTMAEGSMHSMVQAAARWDDTPAENRNVGQQEQQLRGVVPLQQTSAQPSNLLKTLR